MGSSNLPNQLSIWNLISLVSFVLVLIVGIVGNALVCYVFGYKRRKDRTVTETLYFYLGVVDLMTSVTTPPLHIYLTLTFYRHWHFGVAMCKIFVPLVPITTTISAGIILMIGLDRYRVIVTPFKRHYSRKQVHLGVLVTIVLSVASFIHYIIGVTPYPGGTCQVPQVGVKAFSIPNVIMLLVRDITFLAIFIFINVRIYRSLHNRERSDTLRAMTNGDNPNRGNEFRVLVTVGILFFILIFPADLIHLVYTISWLDNDGIPYENPILIANAFAKILHVTNGCVNVFIYSRLHSKFRDVLQDKFTSWRGVSQDEKDYENTRIWQLTSGPMDRAPFLNYHYSVCIYNGKLFSMLTRSDIVETDV